MSILNAVLIGFVQGLTEFLPVSSSAHVSIFGQLIGSKNPGAAFSAIIQIGTELAVLIYFRKEVCSIIANWFLCLLGKNGKSIKSRFGKGNFDAKMGWYIIIGSIPIVVAGVLLQDKIETDFRNLWITASMLILFAGFLYFADVIGKQVYTEKNINLIRSLLFGIGEMLALVPGVSRSGGSITFGLLAGFDRKSSARYSFMLAMPAVFGSGLYELYKAIKGSALTAAEFPGWTPTIVSTVVSFAVGYLVIVVFLKLMETSSYKGFCVYRLVVGVLVFVLLLLGVLQSTVMS
jgi:undecaprenyl-diphosphatase